MFFRQYLHSNPVAVSYLFGCTGKAMGAVVDPIEDADFYIQEAARAGLEIQYVFDTHVHADHISGARNLAERTGAKFALYAQAPVEYPFTPVHDGEQIVLGNTMIQVIHTPGHTPEHISLLVTDHRRGPDPWLVLTGHTMMVGDIGRPDLVAEDGANDLYHTIFDRMLQFPDYLEVHPGAYSGSPCGRALSGKVVSTIGFERRFNPAAQPRTKEEFIKFMLEDLPQKPNNFDLIRAYNLGEIHEKPVVE